MKTILTVSLFITAALALQGCASGFKERKAPCSPTASLAENPCDPLPINIAFSATTAPLKGIIG